MEAFGVPLLNQPSEFAYGVLESNIKPGLLLHGPAGTGQTQFVEALAKYWVTRVLSVSSRHIHNKWLGKSDKAIEAAFMLARKLSPCILFIDEADSLLHKYARDGFIGIYHHNTLRKFLSERIGFGIDRDKQMLVVLATERPSDLDAAILRRAPKRIAIGVSSFQDRVARLKFFMRGKELDSDVSIDYIALKTDRFTGSDLENLCTVGAYASIFEDNAHKTESEAPDEAEDDKRQVKETDIDVVNLEGGNGERTAAERHAENNIDINNEEHAEGIPLLSLAQNTTPATVSEQPLLLPTTDNTAKLVSAPPRRLLRARHFEKAIKDITPM